MRPRLLLQMALLLMAGQAVTGLLGYAARSGLWIWPGLVLLPLLVWFALRAASVLRTEMAEALKRGEKVVPWRDALIVGLLWQLPALVTLPLWMPPYVSEGWQGVLLPWLGVLELAVPGVFESAEPWIWAVFPLWTALFGWAGGKPLEVTPVQPVVLASTARVQAALAEQEEPEEDDREAGGSEEGAADSSGSGDGAKAGAAQTEPPEWKPALRHADVKARILAGERKSRKRR